jgi:hypothetical protein
MIHLFRGFACLLDHVATAFLAIEANLGAFRHVLVFRELAASRATRCAGFGTGLAERDRERTFTGAEFRRSCADVSAIRAGAQGRHMVLMTRGNLVCAMPGARFASTHAVGTDFGAVLHVSVVFFVLGSGLVGATNCGRQSKDGSGEEPHKSQESSLIHDILHQVRDQHWRSQPLAAQALYFHLPAKIVP